MRKLSLNFYLFFRIQFIICCIGCIFGIIQQTYQLKNLAESTQKRKHSASLRRPFSQSTTSDDPQLVIHLNHNHTQTQECDPKQYRLLLHCFYNNLNSYYVKGNKDVLGQLEDLYKVPLSKEQKMSLENDFEGIIARNISKLAKEGLSRNANIGRNLSEYYEAYHRYNRSQFVLQTSNQPSMKTLQLPQSEYQTEPKPKTYTSSYSQGQRSRPQTSVRPPYKQNERTAPILNLNLNLNSNMVKNMQTSIFRNKNAIESGYAYQYTYTSVNTAENQEGCFVYIRENYRKGSAVANSTHSGNRVKYHGRYHRHSTGFGILDQLGIQDVKYGGYKVSDENNMTQNTQAPNQKNHNTSASKQNLQQRSMPKTNLNKFFHVGSSSYASQGQNQSNNLSIGLSSHWNSRQKSIDELERQKIQSKILAMNGTPSANVVKSQGYRPKSKCWGTPVLSHGKIVTNTDPSNSSNGNAKQGLGGKLLFSMMRYK